MTNSSKNEKSQLQVTGGISLVLPCHNEKENIKQVVEEAKKTLSEIAENFEIIIVDDGSTDGTFELAKNLAQTNPHIKLIKHKKNLGYGSALISGFNSAKFRWIFFTDADQQFKISELEKFIAELEKSPMVIGFREKRSDPLHRRLLGNIFSFLIRKIFGISAKDVNCAFKIFDRKVIENKKLISPGALINTELLCLAKMQGIEPVQIPVSHFPRKKGRQSGAQPKVILRAGWEVIRLYFHLRSIQVKK